MGDDLLLLAMRPGSRRVWTSDRLPFALRVAELAELALEGRLAISGVRRRIEVVDDSRVPDLRLNGTLHVLVGRTHRPTLPEWLRETPRGLADVYVSRLTDQKTVRVSRSRGRDGRTRTEILWVDEERHRAVRDRLDAVTGGRVDESGGSSGPSGSSGESDRTLAVLVHMSGLGSHLYGRLLGRGARGRLAALAHADPGSAVTPAAGFTDRAALSEAVRMARELVADLPGAYESTNWSLITSGPGTAYGNDGTYDISGGHHSS